MKPKVAILDEPDSGIDVVSLPHIMNAVVQWRRSIWMAKEPGV